MEQVKKKVNVWKIIAIVLIIADVCGLALKGCESVLAKRQSVPENYTKTVKTGGTLEAKYMAMGDHKVKYYESAAMMSFEKFEIFYPSDLSDMDGSLPVVVFVNGSGTGGSKYQALQKHMASWGFITIATEEQNAWNGFSAEMCVRYLDALNQYQEDGKENAFYGKIDMNRIGITGHSQGGIGVINALTDQKHSDCYKAAVMLSSTETDMAKALLWDSDSSLIHTNIMMISSTGQTDNAISPLESMQKTYNNITNDVSKVLARRNDADHGQMLYYADGYVTAWFMYYLQGNAEAGTAFFGENAELLTNPLYQDQEAHQHN